ncbi:MAG: hypothetical protein ACKOFW_24745, partial [Planctomycetaceae bacterium]
PLVFHGHNVSMAEKVSAGGFGRSGDSVPEIPPMPIQAFVTDLPIVSMERVVPAVRGVTATGHLDCVLPVRPSFVQEISSCRNAS